MNIRTISLLNAVVIFILFIAGCNKDTSGPEKATSKLKIYLTDSPAVYDSVNIQFSEISAHIDSGWVTVQGNPVTVNLLEWNNGKSIIIGEAPVPAGKYTQIRLKIDDADIVVDGHSHLLEVPSGAQTGLKLGPEFTINQGSTYELVIDFDVERSIVLTGPPNNPTGYKLKPHLRVVPMAITGSISGTVTNPEALPTAYALQAGDTVATSIVDSLAGTLMLAFLEEGAYTVSIKDTLGRQYQQENVGVSVGVDNNIGTVTLQ
jgi:hypothetical protein